MLKKKNNFRFDLLILGSSSAIPSDTRFPSAQILNINERLFLIDCGEATQNRLWSHRIRWNKIDFILISHLHGDHVYGLPGLITSFCHLQRETPLTVCGPHGIRDFLENILKHSKTQLSFQLDFIELDSDSRSTVFKDSHLHIRSFPLDHRIPTIGYRFDFEKTTRHLNMEILNQLEIPIQQYKTIQEGKAVSDQKGRSFAADELSWTEIFKRSYAYCSDTRYLKSLLTDIGGVDVLYHETTYLKDLQQKAQDTGHSTSIQAAQMAHDAKAGYLITGHYSSRYENLEAFQQECSDIFPNTILGKEGLKVEICRPGV